MVQMELILEPYLQDKTLGLPYWDWTGKSNYWDDECYYDESIDCPTPEIPDLWSNVPCEIKGSNSSDFSWPFATENNDDTGYEIDCPSDRKRSRISRRTENKLKESFDEWGLNENHLGFLIEDARIKNYQNMSAFGEALSRVHGGIHLALGCRMYSEQTTAYDPIFFLHHSFVEKVFVDWQKLVENYREQYWYSWAGPRPSSQRILAPFDNPKFNPFDLTRITPYDSMDYQTNLCYCYDDCHNVESRGREENCETRYETTFEQYNETYQIGIEVPHTECYQVPRQEESIVPEPFSGPVAEKAVEIGTIIPADLDGGYSIKFSICDFSNNCMKKRMGKFGASPNNDKVIDVNQQIINSENFQLITEEINLKKLNDFVEIVEDDSGNYDIKVSWKDIKILSGQKYVPNVTPPFIIYKVGFEKIIQLNEGVKEEQYGDLLNGFDEVLQYCENSKIIDSKYDIQCKNN